MEKRLLLTTRRNAIFREIVNLGLDPSTFGIIEVDSTTSEWRDLKVSKLIHRKTGYYFLFDIAPHSNSWWCVYFPNEDGLEKIYSNVRWEPVFYEVKTWLNIVKREAESDDLWFLYLTNKLNIDKSALINYENIPFNDKEKAFITYFFNEIKQIISNKLPDKTKIESIHQDLEYLKEASMRQGRKDWVHLAIGVFFTIIFSYGFPKNVSLEVFQMVGKALSKLMTGVDLLP